jgi:hypothetical protein
LTAYYAWIWLSEHWHWVAQTIGIHGQAPTTAATEPIRGAYTETAMKTIKRLFSFIASIGLICAGMYVLYAELFIRFSGGHGRYNMFGVGLILIGSGVVQLWFGFLLPMLLRERI